MTVAAAPSLDVRRNDRGGKTRARIVAAATAIFGDQGLAGARTRDIAAKAAVRPSLIAYYFGSKEALWQACAVAIFRESAERYQRVRGEWQGLDGKTRLKLLLRENAYASSRFRDARQFVLRSTSSSAPPLSAEARAAWDDLRRVQLDTIRELQREGALPAGHDPVLLQAILVGASINLFSGGYDGLVPETPDDTQLLKRHLDALFACFDLG